MDEPYWIWPFSIPVIAIIGSFVYVIIQTLARARVRELEVRERIAMIERGLVPPPEKDPQGFDRAMGRYDTYRDRREYRDWQRRGRVPTRYRSAGITMMGIGFGLMVLIGFAGGAAESGIGVGGFLVVMGLAFFINSLLAGPADDPRYGPPPGPPPSSSSSSSSFTDQHRPS